MSNEVLCQIIGRNTGRGDAWNEYARLHDRGQAASQTFTFKQLFTGGVEVAYSARSSDLPEIFKVNNGTSRFTAGVTMETTLDVQGDITCNSVTANSTRAKKKNIKKFKKSAINLLTQVDVVSYKYKKKYDPDGNIHIGFISEDTPIELTVDGKHMDYTSCIGTLIKAVQELNERLEKLEKAGK